MLSEHTGVRPQVAGEGVPPAAGIVAKMAFEGLLTRVQLDVPQEVAFLGKGGPTLVALERPFTWARREEGSMVSTERELLRSAASRKLFPMGLVTSTGCRFDRT